MGARSRLTLPDYPSSLRAQGLKGNADKSTVWHAIGDLPDIDRIPELLDSDLYRGNWESRAGTPGY